MSVQPAVVREPKQERSRRGWERALEVGLELLQDGGVEALSISEVCRRSRISPPSLYARVDGRAGLFAAVWERGMSHVHATEDRAFAGLPRVGASAQQRAVDAALAIAEVFTSHRAFLRPVIGHAATDPELLGAGAAESRRLLDRIVTAIDVDPALGDDIARTLYAECVLRTLYGADFFTTEPEPEADLRARLARTASARTLIPTTP